ncbi:hypothetical protein EZ313_19670 [Ramlibacter henchirensis]|uniref:HNH endonuclease n=1 Tax=Ramlibacter henchirensis TaxID=204072 RepID=A0A4Z0BPI1_9BURK|nr:hypothetical protein [Ramlibacter henchirensis]TFZ00672.1 hypothetical protein EZ313_19670 [Ramlibacter henchirensis]
MPLEQRRILSAAEGATTAEEVCKLLASRMKVFGQSPSASGGNSTKRIRIRLSAPFQLTDEKVVDVVAAAPERLPASQLEKVGAQDLLFAVEQLLAGASHRFGESTDYDVLLDTGKRLPPKAIFGIAATRALGFSVLPGHFSGGVGTPCFKALEGAGYQIVPKDAPDPEVPREAADREYVEGTPKLRSHLRKERRSGLAAAKKDEFRQAHGRLFCERCEMDPVKVYGDSSGEACIEVHHRAVQVQDMAPGHKTKLSDLKCLCASCHRVVHRRLQQES